MGPGRGLPPRRVRLRPGMDYLPADDPRRAVAAVRNRQLHDVPAERQGTVHAIILAAGTLDTNGGPVINPKAQVLDVTASRSRDCTAPGTASPPHRKRYWGGGSTLGPR